MMTTTRYILHNSSTLATDGDLYQTKLKEFLIALLIYFFEFAFY